MSGSRTRANHWIDVRQEAIAPKEGTRAPQPGRSVPPRHARLVLGRVPDSTYEGDLVHEICKVVEQVQGRAVHAPQEVTEEVAQGVDGPADGDDVAHCREGFLDVLARARELRGALAGLADENLREDEGP